MDGFLYGRAEKDSGGFSDWACEWVGRCGGGFSVVFDADFRLGAAFLEMARLWREKAGGGNGKARLFYHGVISLDRFESGLQSLACALETGFPDCLSGRLGWYPAVPGTHRFKLWGGQLILQVLCGGVDWALDRLEAPVHAWIFPNLAESTGSAGRRLDGLAKVARHSADLAEVYVESARPEEALVLQRSGFELTPCPSRRGQSEALLGRFRTLRRRRPIAETARDRVDRSAMILGAGLAGTAVAAALLRRGWEVHLVERREAPAQGASGNLAAVFSPMISKDDGRAARLSRNCFLELRRELDWLSERGERVDWLGAGVLQLAKDAREADVFERVALEKRFSGDFLERVGGGEASRLLGRAVAGGGIYFPRAGWVNPSSLCEARLRAALLDSPGGTLKCWFGTEVVETEWRESCGRWGLRSREGGNFLTASTLILANGFEAAGLVPEGGLNQKRVRGQVSHLPAAVFEDLKGVVTGEGYLIPAVAGRCLVGASYDFGSEEPALLPESHQGNLRRLRGLLREVPDALGALPLEGRVGFRSLTPDRFPIVGSVARMGLEEGLESVPGLYAIVGLGSRGVVWSGGMGELLGSILEGEPSPMEADLVGAVDPARFLRRGGLSPGAD